MFEPILLIIAFIWINSLDDKIDELEEEITELKRKK